MRIAMIGAGAMGSLFAFHLAKTDAEVWVYDIWREHIDAIKRYGLKVKREGVATAPMQATTDPAEAGVCDAVMIFVKFNQTRAALESAAPMIGPSTIIVTLQNGLGNVEIIRSQFPANRLVFGLTTLTSELLRPGVIEASYSGHGETYLWPESGAPDAEIEQLCAFLVRGGVNASLAPDIELKIWNKLIVNCCLNTTCAITGLAVGPLTECRQIWDLLDGVVDEIVTLAECKGIPLERAQAHSFLRSVAEEARAHFPSMLIDVRSQRPTEIDCLNGAILRECDRHGIPAPHNRALYSIIRILEQTYDRRN